MDIFGSLSSCNWLDVVIIFILVIAIGRGLWAGFSVAVSTFLGVLLGFWVAAQQFPFVAMQLSHLIKDELWRSLTAFGLLFLVVYLGFLVVGIFMRGFFRVIKLAWMDRLLGGAMGLAKGLIFSGVILFLMTLILPENSPVLRNSVLYPSFSRIAQSLNNLAPENLKGRFMWKWRKLKKEHSHEGKALKI